MSWPPKWIGLFFVFSVLLLGVTIIIGSADSGIKSKFEPWLWDNLQELEANGTSRIVSLTILLVADGESLKNYVAQLLVEHHGAKDIWIASVFPTIIAKVNSTEIRKIAFYDFVKLLGDGENPKFSFGIIRAKLKSPIWNLSEGTVDFLLCNEGSIQLEIVGIAINGKEAAIHPSNVLLLPGENITIKVHYPFESNRTYTFILTDTTKTRHGPYDFTAG